MSRKKALPRPKGEKIFVSTSLFIELIEPVVSRRLSYSNWQGPVWFNTHYLYYLALKRYGFDDEARQLAGILGRLVLADIRKWGSMHECYHAETGEGLAPTAEQSKDHVFPGFVGWNLLVHDILQCATNRDCLLLDWPGKN